jgi:hypothetical protein
MKEKACLFNCCFIFLKKNITCDAPSFKFYTCKTSFSWLLIKFLLLVYELYLNVVDLSVVRDKRTELSPHRVMDALSFYVGHFNLTREQA